MREFYELYALAVRPVKCVVLIIQAAVRVPFRQGQWTYHYSTMSYSCDTQIQALRFSQFVRAIIWFTPDLELITAPGTLSRTPHWKGAAASIHLFPCIADWWPTQFMPTGNCALFGKFWALLLNLHEAEVLN